VVLERFEEELSTCFFLICLFRKPQKVFLSIVLVLNWQAFERKPVPSSYAGISQWMLKISANSNEKRERDKRLLYVSYFGGLLSRPFPDGLPVVLGLPPLPIFSPPFLLRAITALRFLYRCFNSRVSALGC
jgi:hypothetical protein